MQSSENGSSDSEDDSRNDSQFISSRTGPAMVDEKEKEREQI